MLSSAPKTNNYRRDFKTRFQGKIQKVTKDGAIEDMTQQSEQKPIQKVSLR